MVHDAVRVNGKTLEAGGHRLDLNSFDRLMVIGGGKATALMASAAESILGRRITAGKVIVPEYQKGLPRLRRIQLLKSTHPLPSQRGIDAVTEMLQVVEGLTERDFVLCLISGGGSALMPLPVRGVSLPHKQAVTRLMLESGASIQEINCVRKHLSALKGGRLTERLMPAAVITLIVSDVVGDDLSSIASGPTVPDVSTFAEAKAILMNHGLWDESPNSVRLAIEKGIAGRIPETPKPDSQVFERVSLSLIHI